MKSRTRGAAVALAAALGMTLGVAPTATAEIATCTCAFTDLRTATDEADYTSRNNAGKDETGLLNKITAAEEKVAEGKVDDAVAKLTDYQLKVMALESSGKIATDADLVTLAQDVIDCINNS